MIELQDQTIITFFIIIFNLINYIIIYILSILKQFNEMPILLQDETNTTKDVLDSGIQSILGKNIKEKGIIDQMVAINLLNSVLIKVQDELYIPR